MFCKKCGNEMKPGERFCAKCGTASAAGIHETENGRMRPVQLKKGDDRAHPVQLKKGDDRAHPVQLEKGDDRVRPVQLEKGNDRVRPVQLEKGNDRVRPAQLEKGDDRAWPVQLEKKAGGRGFFIAAGVLAVMISAVFYMKSAKSGGLKHTNAEKTQQDAQARAEDMIQTDIQVQADGEARADTQAQEDGEARADIQAQADGEAQADTQVQADGEAQADTQAQTDKSSTAGAAADAAKQQTETANELFQIDADAVEDYAAALDPDTYLYYDSEISDFAFYYPAQLFSQAAYSEKPEEKAYGMNLQTIDFTASGGSELEFTLCRRTDALSLEQMTDRIYEQETGSLRDAAKLALSVENDYGRVIVTGYTQQKDRLVYDMVKIEPAYVMHMKLFSPQYTGAEDQMQKGYVTECIYRMCAFSGSSKPPRSYQEYKKGS